MARHLVQLKIESIRGSLRRDAPDRRGTMVSIIASIVLAVLAILLVLVVWNRDADLRGSVAVVAGTLTALASFFVSAATAEAEAVDPRALVFVGRSPSAAARQALASSFVGVAPLCLLVAIVAFVAMWRDDLIALAFAAAGGLVSWVLIVTLGRIGALLGRASGDRRIGGDLVSVMVLVLLLAAAPLLFVLVTAPWGSGAGTVVRLVAEGLAWSPFGGSWGAPAAAIVDGPIAAVAHLGVSVVSLAILLWVWFAFGSRVARGQLGRHRSRGDVDLGLIGRLGRSPAGAIAARTMTYWLRDRRYRVVLLAIVFVPGLALIPLALAGVPPQFLALIPVPLLGFFFGWALHDDLAFDSTALWLHVTASMDGRSDRLGRALPTLWIGGALIILGSGITGLIVGEWFWAISVLGVAACLLFTATGISSITSVLFPYPVARPGDSPFSQPVRSWGGGVWMHPVTGVLAFVAAGPAVAAGIIGIVTDTWWWHLIALGAGLIVGVAILAWGIVEGGRRYNARSSDLMTFATSA